jgi:hypothetical protein
LRDAAALAPRLLFAGAVGLADLAGFVVATAWAAGLSLLAGWSPITDLRGQTLKTGHLAQPTAIAMGQIFMGIFLS